MYKLLKYILPIAVIGLISCESPSECSVSKITADVQEKNVSVYISANSDTEFEQFTWYFNDGFSQATTQPLVSREFSENGSYTVELEALQKNGVTCYYQTGFLINSINTSSDTCDIDISEISIDGNLLQVSTAVETTGGKFTWDTGTGYQITSTNSSFVYSYADTGSFVLSVNYQHNQCQDSTWQVIKIGD